MAASQQLLLKGRYLKKVVKYSIGAGVLTTASGVITYILAKQRTNETEGYLKSMTGERNAAINKRVIKYAGFTRDDRFPHIPMLEDTEGTLSESVKKFRVVEFFLEIEKRVLEQVDPKLKEYFPDLFFYGIKDSWFENESKKEAAQKRLVCARAALCKAVDKYFQTQDNAQEPDVKAAGKELSFYLSELNRQTLAGDQEAAAPLAVAFLPKVEFAE